MAPAARISVTLPRRPPEPPAEDPLPELLVLRDEDGAPGAANGEHEANGEWEEDDEYEDGEMGRKKDPSTADPEGPPVVSLVTVSSAGSVFSSNPTTPSNRQHTGASAAATYSHSLEMDLKAAKLPLQGPLLKRRNNSGKGVADCVAGTLARGLCWRRRAFELGADRLAYWPTEKSRSSSEKPVGEVPTGAIDEVSVVGKQVFIHLSTCQVVGRREAQRDSLVLLATSLEEAEQWASALRAAAAVRLRTVLDLPTEWDVRAMLCGPYSPKEGSTSAAAKAPAARLVAKIDLDTDAVDAIQRLVDHTYLYKRTKDQRGEEVPVRLEVVSVMKVQNTSAWTRYRKVRADLREKARGACCADLVPPVMTLLHEDPVITATLGELDAEAQEQFLFHGTSSAAVEGITNTDFRLDLAGSHRGTLYGNGLYCAECSSKSDEYAKIEEDGLCRMLLCRATLGRIMVNTDRRPSPDIAKECMENHDSLCGDRWTAVGTYREFIVYSSGQVYPQYIIAYRRVMQSTFLQSLGQAAAEHDSAVLMNLVPHAAKISNSHPVDDVRYILNLTLTCRARAFVPALQACLADRRRLVRRSAAALLGNFGKYSKSITSEVGGLDRRNGTNSSDMDHERKAIAEDAIPALAGALEDEDASVAKAAAEAMVYYEQHASPAVPNLVKHVGHENEVVRRACADTLGKLKDAAYHGGALPVLISRCGDEVDIVRQACATAVGSICYSVPRCKEECLAFPAMTALLIDPIYEVRQAAAAAVGQLALSRVISRLLEPKNAVEPEYIAPAIEALIHRLDDTHAEVRQEAAASIGFFGQQASAAAAFLVRCAEDEYDGVRTAAAVSLGKSCQSSDVVINALKKCLSDPCDSVAAAAATSLGQHGPGAASAVHALARGMSHQNKEVRRASVEAVGWLGEHSVRALPSLVFCLNDKEHEVHGEVRMAFKHLGNHAQAAVPHLEALLDSNTKGCEKARVAAGVMLQRLGVEPNVKDRAIAEKLKNRKIG